MAMEQITHEDLKRKLGEVLGEEYGKKLMGYLPDAEVATKADLERLRESMDERFISVGARFTSVDERFNHMEQAIDLKLQAVEGRLVGEFHKGLSEMSLHLGEQMGEQTRNFIFSMVGAMIALATASRFL